MHTIHKTLVAVLLLLLMSPTDSNGQDLSTPKAIFEANIEATGGDAWNDLKTMHTVMEMVMEMEMATVIMTLESWIITPDYLVTKIRMLDGPPGLPEGAGNSTAYIMPDEGWIESFQGRQDISSLPAAQRDQMKASMYAKEELGLLDRPDSVFTLLESIELDGSMAYVVEATAESTTRRFYDHDSLLLIGVETNAPMGGTMLIKMSDYEPTEGVIIARLMETDIPGMGTQTMTMKRVEINDDITPEKLAEMVK